MESITFFNPRLYGFVNIIIVFTLSIFAYINYSGMNNGTLLHSRKRTMWIVFVYMWLFIIVVGMRPLVGCFGDMRAYTWSFERILLSPSLATALTVNNEWTFSALVYIFGKLGGFHLIFFTVTLLYVLIYYLAICRLFKRSDVSLLFLFGFFSFFSYATNTIRAGLAMAIVLLALTYLINFNRHNFKPLLIGLLLCFISFGVHRSSALPVGSFFMGMTILKNCKVNMMLWGLCIVFSLIIGTGLQEGVMSLLMESDFKDPRILQYLGQEANDVFLRTGFRWDFILFSSLPILVGVFVLSKVKSPGKSYVLLLNTYIIANMFWVLVNRAPFSDRFAYLSWFLYPVIVVYPFLKMNIVSHQSSIMCKLLLIVTGFTLLMKLVYYD